MNNVLQIRSTIIMIVLFLSPHISAQSEYVKETDAVYTTDKEGTTWVEVKSNPFLETIICPMIDIEKGEVDDCISSMYSIPMDKFMCLINGDVIGYNELKDRYKTELQRAEFKKTEEYKILLMDFKEAQNCIKNTEFGILYNLRYNNPYSVSKKAFVFSIGVADYKVTNRKGYIGLGNDVCVTFPLKYTNISKVLLDNNYSIVQKITLPYTDTKTALKIEKDMDNPYCSTYLLFKVKIQDVEQIKRNINYGGYIGTQASICDYLLCKTTGLYIVNTDNEEVLGKFNNILTIN